MAWIIVSVLFLALLWVVVVLLQLPLWIGIVGTVAVAAAWAAVLVLRRVRATEQQIGLSRAQRPTNVQGAFQVSADHQSEVQGRRVILIDDVLTSGATLDACARALLRAKAAQVDVLVFARVVESGPRPI